MTPIGWTPEGTATWQRANEALRSYILQESTRERCPWCYGQRGFYRMTELGSALFVLCEGCFGTGVWKDGNANG